MNDVTSPAWRHTAPSFSEIEMAAERIRGTLVETPLLESDRLNARFGGRLLVKAEGLQRTGSFKARAKLLRWARRRRLCWYAARVVRFPFRPDDPQCIGLIAIVPIWWDFVGL